MAVHKCKAYHNDENEIHDGTTRTYDMMWIGFNGWVKTTTKGLVSWELIPQWCLARDAWFSMK